MNGNFEESFDYFPVGSSAEVDGSTKDCLRLFLNKYKVRKMFCLSKDSLFYTDYCRLKI